MIIRRQDGETEIDLLKCCEEVIKHLIVILVIAAIVAGAAFIITNKPAAPTYTAQGAMYVRPYNYLDGEGLETEFSSNKPNTVASIKTMMNTYMYYMTSNDVIDAVINECKLNYKPDEVKEMITTKIVDDSYSFTYTVTTPTAEEAVAIVKTIARIFPEKSMSFIEDSKIVPIDDENIVATLVPASTGSAKTALIAFFATCFVLAGCIVLIGIIKESANPLVHNEEELKDMYSDALILNNFAVGNKKNLLLHDFQKKDKKKKVYHLWEDGFCQKCRDGYRNLRSSLISAVNDEHNVIGLTDCLDNDNNIDVATNIAYSLSQIGKQVLVIDANIYDNANCKNEDAVSKSGLSDIILDDAKEDNIIKSVEKNSHSFDFLPCGQTGSADDVLSSPKMTEFVDGIKEKYDYVVISFASSKYADYVLCKSVLDGLVVITKNDALLKNLSACVEKIKLAGIKLVGFIIK